VQAFRTLIRYYTDPSVFVHTVVFGMRLEKWGLVCASIQSIKHHRYRSCSLCSYSGVLGEIKKTRSSFVEAFRTVIRYYTHPAVLICSYIAVCDEIKNPGPVLQAFRTSSTPYYWSCSFCVSVVRLWKHHELSKEKNYVWCASCRATYCPRVVKLK
jgi:hypothetical protein